jgi:hypothetical protein
MAYSGLHRTVLRSKVYQIVSVIGDYNLTYTLQQHRQHHHLSQSIHLFNAVLSQQSQNSQQPPLLQQRPLLHPLHQRRLLPLQTHLLLRQLLSTKGQTRQLCRWRLHRLRTLPSTPHTLEISMAVRSLTWTYPRCQKKHGEDQARTSQTGSTMASTKSHGKRIATADVRWAKPRHY